MKLLHLADMHLGKSLHQTNLLSIQKQLLDQVIDYIKNHEVDGLLLAGDIYDRAIPPQEAVEVLNDFLTQVIFYEHKKVFMISGNHDSSERLNFGSKLLEKNELYIETFIQKEICYHEIDDVRIYMLPFFRPYDLKMIDENAPTKSYDEAMRYYFNMQKKVDKKYTNILIFHGFVGHQALTSESETMLSVGGSEIISPDIFEDFDYVALGHLHAPQSIHRKTIQYSGSLYKYSFDEQNQKKGFIVYDTKDKRSEFIVFSLPRDVKIIKETYDHLMYQDVSEYTNDFLSIELQEKNIIPHAIENLKRRYPYILKLTYPELLEYKDVYHKVEKIEKMSIDELYASFYEKVSGEKLDEGKRQIIIQAMEDLS